MITSMTDPDAWARDAEARLLDAVIRHAPRLGWSRQAIAAAAPEAGLGPADVELLAPNGPADLAALLSRRHDARTLEALSGLDPASLKIRERIRAAVGARLDVAADDAAAVRRWAGRLALPANLPLAGRLLWESADGLWRWAGDTSTDENHYSKRAILSGILAAGLALRIHSGRDEAMAFVDRRISDVMAFEAWKAGRGRVHWLQDVAAGLARLRYG